MLCLFIPSLSRPRLPHKPHKTQKEMETQSNSNLWTWLSINSTARINNQRYSTATMTEINIRDIWAAVMTAINNQRNSLKTDWKERRFATNINKMQCFNHNTAKRCKENHFPILLQTLNLAKISTQEAVTIYVRSCTLFLTFRYSEQRNDWHTRLS